MGIFKVLKVLLLPFIFIVGILGHLLVWLFDPTYDAEAARIARINMMK